MNVRPRSLRRPDVLALGALIVATALGCRSNLDTPFSIQREFGLARAATVPSDAEGVTESGLELSGTQRRATWRFRQAREVTAMRADAETQLAESGYRCRQEGRVLNCAKSLPGDRLNVVMTASDVDGTVASWNVEFTARPD